MRGNNEKASNTSSSERASIDEITQDREKALTGQAPVPVDPGVLEKLDSRVVNVEEGDNDPLDHLPEHERQILKRQLDVPTVKVTYLTLYRYATTWDKVIIAISAICAFAGGAILPLMTVRHVPSSCEASMADIDRSYLGNLQGLSRASSSAPLPKVNSPATWQSSPCTLSILALASL